MVLPVLLTFVLTLGIIGGAYWLFVLRTEQKTSDTIRRRLEGKRADKPARSELTKKESPLSALKVLDAVLERSGHFIEPMKRTIANSALDVSVGVVVLGCVFAATVMFLILEVLLPGSWTPWRMALVAAPLPYAYVRRAASKRLAAMEEQLPTAVDMIAASLRAGHAFTTGLMMVAEELPAPLGPEFRHAYDQQNYGKPLPDVLREFATRVPLLDARIFVTAVLTQREAGGNLAEVLDRLAAVIRERFRVRRQVKAISSHGRITGWVLASLPPSLAVILYVTVPSHVMTMVDDPFGRQLIAAAIGLQILGTLAIRRIVHIEF